MKEIKHKKVIVKCLKDSQESHYQETFKDISEEDLKIELNTLVAAGFWGFKIDRDSQMQTLVLNC